MEGSTVFTTLTECVTNVVSWLGTVLDFILGEPFILVPMLMFFVVGGVVGILMRLWRS